MVVQLRLIETPPAHATGFDEFWKLAPKKLGKLEASVIFRQITGPKGKVVELEGERVVLQATEKELIDGMAAYRKSLCDRYDYIRDDVDLRYEPRVSTLLHRGFWMDYQ